MLTIPPKAEMQRAMLKRDAGYDGVFFVAVRTTSIFCRPACPAKKPHPKNVEYFASARDALFAGYRPCKRCRPLDTNGRPPTWVRRLLDAVEANPSARLRDADLRRMAIEPARARRYFHSQLGMTFQAYHRARRLGLALAQIREGNDLTNVALKHGYESDSGFRDAFVRTFGKPPGRSRDAEMIRVKWIESPVGPLILGATDKAVCLLEFTDRRALETQIKTLRGRFDCSIVPGTNEPITQATEELGRYFAGKLRRFRVPITYPGTPFQVSVWKRLLQIPYGQTISYEHLAAEIGHKGAQRAVGTANGKNRIAIIIPCHRVVNKSGQLGGYGGGLWRKQFLLDLEQGQLGLA
jgi:AraC family transcriptional regulator of adaptative response/methylated-DNA-[protein]-cysteine methyltransferase